MVCGCCWASRKKGSLAPCTHTWRAGQWSLPEELAAPDGWSWIGKHRVSYEPWDGAAWGLVTVSELMLRLSKNNYINEAIYLLLYSPFYLQVMLYCTFPYRTSMLLYRVPNEDVAFTKIFWNFPFFPLLLEYMQYRKRSENGGMFCNFPMK